MPQAKSSVSLGQIEYPANALTVMFYLATGTDTCDGLLGASIGGGIGPLGGLYGFDSVRTNGDWSRRHPGCLRAVLRRSLLGHSRRGPQFWNHYICKIPSVRLHELRKAMNADFRIKASGAAGVFNYMRSQQRNNLSFEVGIPYNATYGSVGFPS